MDRVPHNNLKRKVKCDEINKTKAARTCDFDQETRNDSNGQSSPVKYSIEEPIDAMPAFAEVVSSVSSIGEQTVLEQIQCRNKEQGNQQLFVAN